MTGKYHIWHNGMCITYLLRLKQFEDFFRANGWREAVDPQDADCVVLGACAAFEPYFERFAKKVRECEDGRREVVVYGCLPTVNPRFYREHTDKSTVFIPSRYPERIAEVIADRRTEWKDVPLSGSFREKDYVHPDPKRRFVLIQEGCNEKCVYCPHRLGIGRERSVSLDEVLAQVRKGIDEGADTFVLEGNNGGAWGLDLHPRRTFADLLRAVLSLSDEIKVHVGDFHAKWLREYGESLDHPQVTDIKIPIQSTSARLLETMGRDPYVVETAPLLKRMKSRERPPFLRTEIIIGFPTSTREELMDTLAFVVENFHKVACYSYDFHPQTKIARMEIEQLPDEEIAAQVETAIEFLARYPNVQFQVDDRGRICNQITEEKRRRAGNPK